MLQMRNDLTADSEDGLPVPRRWLAVAAISFGVALLVIDGQIAIVALPTIARELGVSSGAVTSVVTIYQLVMVMGVMPLASLGERIGHRKLYQAGQILFCLASIGCFFVNSFAMLLVLRTFQGLGASMAMAVNVAIIRRIYPAANLGAGLGFNSVIVASSAAIAPTLGGFIAANFPWQMVFVAAAPLAGLSLLLGRSLPELPPTPGKSNLLASMWSAGTMAMLVGGVQLASHDATRLAGAIVFVLGIVSAVFLLRRESSQDRPIVPVDLMRMPAIGMSALAALAVFLAGGALMVSLPFRLEQGMGFASDEVGLLLLPFPLTMLFVSPFAGWLSDRVAPTKIGVPGLVVAIIGLLLIAHLPDQPHFWDVAWRLSLTALGFGSFLAPNSRLLVAQTPMDRTAAAGGLLSTSRLLGQASASALVGLLLGLNLGMGMVPYYVAVGFTLVAAGSIIMRFRHVRASRARANTVDMGI